MTTNIQWTHHRPPDGTVDEGADQRLEMAIATVKAGEPFMAFFTGDRLQVAYRSGAHICVIDAVLLREGKVV